jgi:phage pi2 protein 07
MEWLPKIRTGIVMEKLWAEIEVEVTIKEKCILMVRVEADEFKSVKNLMEMTEAAASKHVAKTLSQPDSTQLSSVTYGKKIQCYYPDVDNRPNYSCPIEKDTIQEFIDGHSSFDEGAI